MITLYGLKKLVRILDKMGMLDSTKLNLIKEDGELIVEVVGVPPNLDDHIRMVDIVESEHATVFAIGGTAYFDVEDLNKEGD